MAVLDYYVNTDLAEATYKTSATLKTKGSKLITIVSTFEVAAADDDGSVYRIIKGLPSTMVPVSLRIACDALTGSNDWDVGLYTTDLGAVVDKDILADGINLSAGYSRILALDGLVTVDIANAYKMLWELPINGTAYTIRNRPRNFDIALTANTVGSGAGTVTVWSSWFNP